MNAPPRGGVKPQEIKLGLGSPEISGVCCLDDLLQSPDLLIEAALLRPLGREQIDVSDVGYAETHVLALPPFWKPGQHHTKFCYAPTPCVFSWRWCESSSSTLF